MKHKYREKALSLSLSSLFLARGSVPLIVVLTAGATSFKTQAKLTVKTAKARIRSQATAAILCVVCVCPCLCVCVWGGGYEDTNEDTNL